MALPQASYNKRLCWHEFPPDGVAISGRGFSRKQALRKPEPRRSAVPQQGIAIVPAQTGDIGSKDRADRGWNCEVPAGKSPDRGTIE